MEIIQHPVLYKRDSNGNIREWHLERQGSTYRTVAGVRGGKMVYSEWRQANARSQATDEAQAIFEIESQYRHQLERDYFERVEEVDTPRIFEPMLAHTFAGWKGPCYSQPKLDGIRCIATAKGLWSRAGKAFLNTDHIIVALAPYFERFPDAIIDGELYNHELKDDFNAISSLVKKKKRVPELVKKSAEVIQFHVYDQFSHVPFIERYTDVRRDIEQLGNPCLRVVPTTPCRDSEQLDRLYSAYLIDGYEGQMVRSAADTGYEKKRSRSLLKRKEFQSAEFEVDRIEEGQGNWAGHAKRAILRLPDGRQFGAGIAGNKAFTKELLHQTHKVATVKFFDYTPDGIPRFGVVTQWHGDKREY